MDHLEPSNLPVSRLLTAIESGDPRAADELLPLMYAELRRLAQHMMNAERTGQSLEATCLVHEAYVRLVGPDESQRPPRFFADRRHFFNAAAQAMRRVLVDRARRRSREKHGGHVQREVLDAVRIPATDEFGLERMDDLDLAMRELASHNQRWAEIAQLRYLLGLSIDQTAETLGLTAATVKSDWTFARAWLRHKLLKTAQ